MAKKKSVNGEKKARTPKTDGPRAGTKTEEVARMLQRKTGATRADLLEATGWPAISVQTLAKACRLKLTLEKEKGQPTRYFGAAA